MPESAMRHAPAAERNRDPILAVLRQCLPERGTVLEIASGTGQHVVHFAAALPELRFVPSDLDPSARRSVDAWVAQMELPNVDPALELDTTAWPWPIERADAIFCANMIHISPEASTLGLLDGAQRILAPGAPLALYGPFFIEGQTAPSNVAFDADLRRRDPRWGVRELRDVERKAADRGLALEQVFEMPANNRTVVFRRTGGY